MAEDILVPIFVCGTLFVGLPWVILHYVTKWKTAATLTRDDETMLEELYQLARRLDDRMNTVERLVRADNPDFAAHSLTDDSRNSEGHHGAINRPFADERTRP